MSGKILFLYSRIRVEEKLLIQELERRQVDYELQDIRGLRLRLDRVADAEEYSLVWDRSLSLGSSLPVMRYYANSAAECLNSPETIACCGDKLQTHIALAAAGLATPRTIYACSAAEALAACEELGWPVVIKPTVGSWGRLVSKLNDRDAAEALIEHRDQLCDWTQKNFYVQRYVRKPGRDLRVFVIDGVAVAAIERRSESWITNTAQGATAHGLTLTPTLRDVSVRAAAAVGAVDGQVAVDIVEDECGVYLVLEVNHSLEFRNSISATGVDIPGLMVEHAIRLASSCELVR